MNASRSLLTSAIAAAFALFLFGSTFSIAIAQTMFGVSLALFTFQSIRNRYNPFSGQLKPVYIAIAAFIVWEIIAALVGATPLRSLRLMREEWLFAIIPVGIWVLQEQKYQRWCLWAFILGVLTMGDMYGIFQHFTGIDLYKGTSLIPTNDYGYYVSGTFLQGMTFGNYYAVAGIFLLGLAVSRRMQSLKIPTWLFFAVGALSLLVSALAFIRGAMTASVIGMLVLGIMLGRKYVVRTVIVLVLAGILLVLVKPAMIDRFSHTTVEEQNTDNLMSRRTIWGNSLDIIRQNLLFGVGAGNFKPEYTLRLPPTAPDRAKHAHAHDDLLNEAAVSGLPGVTLYVTIWILMLRFIWRKRAENPFALAAIAASVAFFVTSITEATFVDEEVRQLLMAVWAFGLLPYFQPVSQGETGRENNLTAPRIPA